jgi:hypothetical protein
VVVSEVLIPVLLAGAFVFVSGLLFLTGHCERLLDAAPASRRQVPGDPTVGAIPPGAIVEALAGDPDAALTGIA